MSDRWKQPFSLFKRGKVFHFWYYHGGKRYGKTTGKTIKSEAWGVAQDFVNGLKPEGMLFETFAKDFFIPGKCQWLSDEHDFGRDNTVDSIKWRRSHVVNYFIPFFKPYTLPEIDADIIKRFFKQESVKKLSGQSKNHLRYSLDIMLAFAVSQKCIKVNPVESVPRFVNNHKTKGIFTPEELERLFTNPEKTFGGIKKYGLLFSLLYFTGIRCGELRALKWNCVSWNPAGIVVNRAMKKGGREGNTKTGDYKAIPIPISCVRLLEDFRNETVFNHDEDYIFTGERIGKPITHKTIERHFLQGLKNAKISAGNRTPHSFRHQFITSLRRKVDGKVLRSMTGHTTEKMPEHYDHPTGEELLENAWANYNPDETFLYSSDSEK